MEDVIQYIKSNLKEIDLVIFDWNGVLDNQECAKRKLIRKVIGEAHKDIENSILVDIERNFEQKKELPFEQNLRLVFKQNNFQIEGTDLHELVSEFSEDILSSSKLQTLLGLRSYVRLAIYTSANLHIDAEMTLALSDANVLVYDRARLIEEKPSIKNLREICKTLGIVPERTMMIGDNPTQDLMPAKLLGMHTILMNPYVDYFSSSSIAATKASSSPAT